MFVEVKICFDTSHDSRKEISAVVAALSSLGGDVEVMEEKDTDSNNTEPVEEKQVYKDQNPFDEIKPEDKPVVTEPPVVKETKNDFVNFRNANADHQLAPKLTRYEIIDKYKDADFIVTYGLIRRMESGEFGIDLAPRMVPGKTEKSKPIIQDYCLQDKLIAASAKCNFNKKTMEKWYAEKEARKQEPSNSRGE